MHRTSYPYDNYFGYSQRLTFKFPTGSIFVFVALIVSSAFYIIMAPCIYCGVMIVENPEYEYSAMDMGPEIVAIVEERNSLEVAESDQLCQECVNFLLLEARYMGDDYINSQQTAPRVLCVSCGISLNRRSGRRSYLLHENTTVWQHISNLINPLQIPENSYVCNICWQRAYNFTRRNIVEAQPNVVINTESSSSQPDPISEPSSEMDNPALINPPIMLEGYCRTANRSECFVHGCVNEERLKVPRYLRKKLLIDKKLYVTPEARICREHITIYNWEIIDHQNYIASFTNPQIIEMLELLAKEETPTLEFENVQNMDGSLCNFWTGLTILQFLNLFGTINQLSTICRKPKTALAAYLIKLRTGEPQRRISTLLGMSKGLVSLYIKRARACLKEFYVPQHLGVMALTRDNISNRNLTIPKGLFGTGENNLITICDGTYIYIQKSSNYLFQKRTYSLHKYANLIKPFILVASDGYIIDIFGPYPATTSDATIMRQLFSDESSSLRQFFRPNDVLILDRGFRDSIPLLESLHYKVHKPESLGVGETQLSTDKANKSRLVTLCRWVVEIVNGRFKRDFKIFRNKYFNLESRNLIDDFRVAGALLNQFHPVITDRPDAQDILYRARLRLNMPNYLADHVIGHHLNRHRATFTEINGNLPQLDMFPIMEMSDLVMFSLGIYQIKQARSYYGEHIRTNGRFIIEICNDLRVINVPGITTSHDTVLLRGRIKSRHQSSKVYYSYILLKTDGRNWEEKICGYYCTCLVGKRTVGSCVHNVTIVWYLGWARHQNSIFPPAQFLDDILVTIDIDQ